MVQRTVFFVVFVMRKLCADLVSRATTKRLGAVDLSVPHLFATRPLISVARGAVFVHSLGMTTTQHIVNADGPNASMRQRRYVDGVGKFACLDIYKEDLTTGYTGRSRFTGKVVVRWNVNAGRGWCKGWQAKFKSEAEAMAFADAKWATVVAWTEKQASEAA